MLYSLLLFDGLSSVGMSNVAVGNLSVYMGALLVMLLGFISGIFGAGATRLAAATPESIREAIAEPFQIVQSSSNDRTEVTDWFSHLNSINFL